MGEAMTRKLSTLLLALAASVGCGGAGDAGDAGPPSTPTGVRATPGNGTATVTWSASGGATSYSVHYDASPTVTAVSPSLTVPGTTVNVPALANGAPYWFAVTAVNDAGESSLSGLACAVPTAASQAGLTFRDGLCGTTLDGGTWWPAGLATARVVAGAAELGARMDGMEPFAANGAQYHSSVNVLAPGVRVSTLRAKVSVPSGASSVQGTGVQNRVGLRLTYSPPANRLLFPRGSQDLLLVEVGLIDEGSGLAAFRQVTHCDDASCASHGDTGIAFVDPAGWADHPAGAPMKRAGAAYDTVYTIEVRLAETEGTVGVLHWSIAGGAFGGGDGGTADPATYLGDAPGWTGDALSGTGFAGATLAARTSDRSSFGGGSGQIVGLFDDVWVGTNDLAAEAFDDFSGTGGNSGPTELSIARWANGGARSISSPGGALAMTLAGTGAGAATAVAQALTLADPSSVNALQADLRIASWSAGDLVNANALVRGRFYNDGTVGGAPGSALGDVFAAVALQARTDEVFYYSGRCQNAACSGALGMISSGTFPAPVGSGVHTVLLKWDPVAKRLTFGLDGATAQVDPTATVPFAGPAHAPLRDITTVVAVQPTVGSAGSLDVRVNNVFTGP
jgi:hypothetical protein